MADSVNRHVAHNAAFNKRISQSFVGPTTVSGWAFYAVGSIFVRPVARICRAMPTGFCKPFRKQPLFEEKRKNVADQTVARSNRCSFAGKSPDIFLCSTKEFSIESLVVLPTRSRGIAGVPADSRELPWSRMDSQIDMASCQRKNIRIAVQ